MRRPAIPRFVVALLAVSSTLGGCVLHLVDRDAAGSDAAGSDAAGLDAAGLDAGVGGDVDAAIDASADACPPSTGLDSCAGEAAGEACVEDGAAGRCDQGGSCCATCIDALMRCAPPNDDTRCGLGGGACQACGAHDQCAGSCEAIVEAIDLTVGDYHSCARARSGDTYCWGIRPADTASPLGQSNFNTIAATVTAAVSPVPEFAAVGAGGFFVDGSGREFAHTCALDEEGRAICWGENNQLQSGVAGAGSDVARPIASELRFSEIATAGGRSFAIGADRSELFFWGEQWMGTADSAEPLRLGVSGATPPLHDLAVSVTGVCVLDSAPQPQPYCIGPFRPVEFQNSRPLTVRVVPGGARTVAVSPLIACALDADGNAWCWGRGDCPQPTGVGACPSLELVIGLESPQSRVRPLANGTWDEIAVGGVSGAFVCGLRRESICPTETVVECWGYLGHDEGLGLSEPATATPDAPVGIGLDPLGGWHDLSCSGGGHFCCALSADGRIVCFGRSDRAQAGRFSPSPLGPTRVLPLPR